MKISWPKAKRLVSFYLLPFLIFFLFLIFIKWVVTTVVPVALVEVKYQYHHTLTTVFNVPDLKSLIVPDFSWMTWEGYSKHQEYGIRIPAIFLDEPVIFNVDPNDPNQYKKALKEGIAHASSTSFPDNPGLGYYFAHSSSGEVDLRNNAIFYLLGKLVEGDSVFIWHHGQKFEYEVYGQLIVEPNDVGFLYQEYDGEKIVLQTCWPPGSDRQRLLVFAQRVN